MAKQHHFLTFESPKGDCVLTFEDNEKVAYAYLKQGGKIISAVWLYNRCQTPEKSEWADRTKIPFANCKGYVTDDARMEKEIRCEDVKVKWFYEAENPVVYVYVFEDLYGVLDIQSKIGYARHAIKDGPLAKVMQIE